MEQPGAPVGSPPPAFHVMLKPRGPLCNLDCSYCFYLKKEELFPEGTRFRMSDEVLEEFTRQYLAAQQVPEATFAWQGGEPTLMGLDFFRRALELQKQHRRPGMKVTNSLQTNGVLLNDEWCAFLKEHDFLVGLSLDGPRELHDAYRVDKGGQPTFDRVERALRLLQSHGVEHNILCVVSRANAQHPLPVYRYFRSAGVRFIQFIPAVERLESGGVTEWSVTGEQWGGFLCAVFDEWVRRDVGRVFVQHFDVALAAYYGLPSAVCIHAEECGNCLALEHDGSLFACDHYVTQDHYLGDIGETHLREMVDSPFQRRFGKDKRETLPRYCRECPVLFACNGGCPKDRFIETPDGEPGLNYLCEGYRRFFTHVGPKMRVMADLIRRGRPAADILGLPEEPETSRAAGPKVGRNAPCHCGSGRKYKHCCLRS